MLLAVVLVVTSLLGSQFPSVTTTIDGSHRAFVPIRTQDHNNLLERALPGCWMLESEVVSGGNFIQEVPVLVECGGSLESYIIIYHDHDLLFLS